MVLLLLLSSLLSLSIGTGGDIVNPQLSLIFLHQQFLLVRSFVMFVSISGARKDFCAELAFKLFDSLVDDENMRLEVIRVFETFLA